MQQARCGFCRLEVLAALGTLAFRRLADVLSAVGPDSRRGSRGAGDLLVAVSADIRSALERSSARLRSAFPEAPSPPPFDGPGDTASLLAALRDVQRLWVGALGGLADDNELDVPRRGVSGRQGLTIELVAEAILENAELAGRLAARLGV